MRITTRMNALSLLTCLCLAVLLLFIGSTIIGCNGDEDGDTSGNGGQDQEITVDQPVERHIYFKNGQIEDAAGNATETVHVYQKDIVFFHNEETHQIKIGFRQNKILFGVLKAILYPNEEPLQLHVRYNAEIGEHDYDPEVPTITLPGPKIVVDPPN